MSDYLHGYSREEQERLGRQAERLRSIIADRIRPPPRARVLEIGCGCGSVLGQVAAGHPESLITGLDISAEQVEAARVALREHSNVRLVDGDALSLPFEDASFDYLYGMWVLEHIPDVQGVLAEARRVLTPGGSISLIEADYWSLRAHPFNDDLDLLFRSYARFFGSRACADLGNALGPHLAHAGFTDVRADIAGFHWFAPTRTRELDDMATECRELFEPVLADMARHCEVPIDQLRSGMDALRSLAGQSHGSLSGNIYNGRAVSP